MSVPLWAVGVIVGVSLVVIGHLLRQAYGTRAETWEVHVGDTQYHIHGLSRREFERLFAETVEVSPGTRDFEAYLKRWVNEDEGEWFTADGDPYPEGAKERDTARHGGGFM